MHDLASIADGRVDAFWEYGLARWDLVAGVVLVEEAGGLVTDLRGGETGVSKGFGSAASKSPCPV